MYQPMDLKADSGTLVADSTAWGEFTTNVTAGFGYAEFSPTGMTFPSKTGYSSFNNEWKIISSNSKTMGLAARVNSTATLVEIAYCRADSSGASNVKFTLYPIFEKS